MSTIRKTRRKRLDLGSAGITMTPAEFDAIRDWDDRFRYELIRGVLVVSRYPSLGERDPNEELGSLLREYKRNEPQGSVLDATFAECCVYSGKHRRRADRLIWSGLGRAPDVEEDLPTIAIEFVSKSRSDWIRDYEEKRAESMALGIAEYWVIDRFARTMTVFRQPPHEPAKLVIPADGSYMTPLLPGFELSLAVLFAMADRWPARKPRRRGGPDPAK